MSPAMQVMAASGRQPFRIGACDWSIDCRGELKAFDVAREIGLDGVQVSFGGGDEKNNLRLPDVRKTYLEKAADSRVAIASLAMGAEGMNMGTRFMATKEAPIHENVKRAIVAASELDTRLVMRPLRNTERVLKNAATERLLEKEKALGSALKFQDIMAEVAGVYPKIMLDGEMDAGVWSCGMVAGLIHDIPTCKELIDRIMSEADALIRQRLEGMLGGRQAA